MFDKGDYLEIMKSNVISKKSFENKRRYLEREKFLKKINEEVFNNYKSEIKAYIDYCDETEQTEDEESFLDYLYVSIVDQQVKKTTWEKRLVAIRKYLSEIRNIKFSDKLNAKLADLRQLYHLEDFTELKKVKGKSSLPKEELLSIIEKLPIREKAICLVNMVTANRPNEMVRLRIKDFDLEGRSVSVYMKKQKEWYNKRLTLEAVKAVKEYISAYNLKPEDYFVGRTYKNGRYESKQISETAYRKQLRKWTGLSPYNFRKTQVSAMHLAGADLSTIAKQTGHKSVHTLEKHYLNVSDATVDKYL